MVSMLKAQAGPDYPQGQEPVADLGVRLGEWQVTEESVRDYTRAVGDSQDTYFQTRLAPPLALVAWTLGSLLRRLDLPSGAIHSLQEMETLRGVEFGENITAFAQIGQPRRRGDLEFITTNYTLLAADGEEVLRGLSTVLVNRGTIPESPSRESKDAPPAGPEKSAVSPGHSLPVVDRTINQDQLAAYAQASGDHNPLHLDPEFAATTQFGGIIAHGMLTLALVSEAMGRAYGRAWLESGALKIKFKGAAYLGDHLYTQCNSAKQDAVEKGIREVCSVGVLERESRRELVSGSASVIVSGENSSP